MVAEVADGLEAVQKARDLKPELVLLDIVLPKMNGFEVARQIRKLSPKSEILFVSQESSADMMEEAFRTGAMGYVIKTDAATDLLNAIAVLLRGEQFVGERFASHRNEPSPRTNT